MGDFNARNNRAVWFDIPVADLERANAFYSAMLDVKVFTEEMQGFSFGVLDHKDGNGGCLVPRAEEISGNAGILLYMNAEGRIRDAVAQAKDKGGQVIEDVHGIGPHGFRAILLDSEGNRIALHSSVDA